MYAPVPAASARVSERDVEPGVSAFASPPPAHVPCAPAEPDTRVSTHSVHADESSVESDASLPAPALRVGLDATAFAPSQRATRSPASCAELDARAFAPRCAATRLALVVVAALALLAPRAASAQSAPDPDPWWGPDKALHLGLSAAIAGTGYGIAAAFTESRPLRLLIGGSAGLLAGTAKELLDLAGLGDPSWKDFTWDVIGTACGVLVAFLLDAFVITPLLGPAPQPG